MNGINCISMLNKSPKVFHELQVPFRDPGSKINLDSSPHPFATRWVCICIHVHTHMYAYIHTHSYKHTYTQTVSILLTVCCSGQSPWTMVLAWSSRPLTQLLDLYSLLYFVVLVTFLKPHLPTSASFFFSYESSVIVELKQVKAYMWIKPYLKRLLWIFGIVSRL